MEQTFTSRHPERSSAASSRCEVEGPVFPRRATAIFRLFALIATIAATLTLPAQTPLFHDPSQPAANPPQVQYLYPEQVTVAAGKPQSVTLHFRVAPGLHINSHAPRDPSLIPTALTLPTGSGVTLQSARYPDGAEYVLPADPTIKLAVYTGDFTIDAHLVATPGNHLIQVQLRFQACDQNACMPPRTITAPISVIAK